MIEKGVISALLNGGKSATVIPSFSDDQVSAALTVPFFLVGCLSVGMAVAYAEFEDNTGVILARMDGEWNRNISGNVTIQGNVTLQDMTSATVNSYNAHKHSTSLGDTSAPK